MTLPFHPLADLFPLTEGEEFDALVADIKANGLREKITIHDGKILDGRNRYRAAIAAGLLKASDKIAKGNVLFIRFFEDLLPDDGAPLDFVISKNLHRRHLNESQRAMAAAKLANLDAGRPKQTSQNCDNAQICAVSQADAAERLNVSRRSVQHATVVQDRGSDDLRQAVERGQLAVSAAAKASSFAPEVQKRIVDEAVAGRADVVKLVVKQEGRAKRERDLGARQLAGPEGLFGVIVEDFEWDHEVYSRETGMDRHASNHYETAANAHTAEEIVARTAERFACGADDCVAFIWTTIPHLAIALDVMKLRGLKYSSHCIWEKDRLITGYWFRGKHELLLVGTRGKVPAPAMGTQFPSVIKAPAGAHSAKPEIFLEMIERYYPTLPKIELNRRGAARPGWSAWGNEAVVAEAGAA